MHITNKLLKEWAAGQGFQINSNVVVVPGEVPVGVSIVSGNNYYVVAAAVDSSRLDKDVERAFKAQAKSYGAPAVLRNQGIVQISVSAFSKKTILRKIEAAVSAMPGILRESGLAQSTACPHCGDNGGDTIAVANGAPRPAHTACVQEQISKVLYEIEDNKLNGNYLFASLAAVVGAVVGAVPSFISMYYFEYMIGILFALIPLGAAFAYQRAGGIQSKLMPVIVSVISLLGSGALFIALEFVIFKDLFMKELSYSLSFGEFLGFLVDPEFSGDFLSEYAQVFLFCVLGIIISWRYMANTNNAKMKELQEMQQSAAVTSANTSDSNQ